MFQSVLPALQRQALLFAMPLGALLALAFAPFGVWPLSFLCLTFLFLLWQDQPRKRAAKIGFLFTGGTFLAGTYWLYHSIYVIGHAPIALTLVLMLGLVAAMGGFVAFLGYAQARWLPDRGLARWLLA